MSIKWEKETLQDEILKNKSQRYQSLTFHPVTNGFLFGFQKSIPVHNFEVICKTDRLIDWQIDV